MAKLPWHGLTDAEVEAEWAESAAGFGGDPQPAPIIRSESLMFPDPEDRWRPNYRFSRLTQREIEAEWAESEAGFGPAIDIKVSGVDELAKSFETLSDRAHKQLIPVVLEKSVNRLNAAIVQNIPVGPRGREGDTGGWRNAQSRMRATRLATRGRHTTTVAAPLPSEQDLGILPGESFYPLNLEFGTYIHNALAPIRRAVEGLERSVLGEVLDLMGHGLGVLAIPVGVGLLLRKAIYGRTTPEELMPIDFTRTRGGINP